MSLSPRPKNFQDDLATGPEATTPTERPSKRRRTTHSGDAGNQETGLMREGGLPRFVGSGSGIHFISTVYGILARINQTPCTSREQLQLVPGEDDQLQDSPQSMAEPADTPGTQAHAPFWTDEEVIPGGDVHSPSITFDALIEWTRSYFEVWHPAFPFLHGPEVLEVLETVANKGIENVSGPDATIVRAMVSISLADARQLPNPHGQSTGPLVLVPSNIVFLSLDHVASCALFVLGTPASLKNMQAALCIELFLVSMLKLNMASRLGGIVVRMAYHLGLHRCPRRYPNFNTHDVSMRKRIWWSFYCIERLVCQALGLPLDVQDDDVDVCFPTTELHHKTTDIQASDQNEVEASNQLQLLTLLSKHAQLRGMILELRHKSLHVRQDSIERALDVQSKLTRWSNEVHDIIMNDQTDNESDSDGKATAPSDHDDGSMSPLYRTLLLVLQHESTIALNRPLLAKKPMTSASQAALQACIHASRAIIEAADDQQAIGDKLAEGKYASSRLLIVWPLLTWSVWMSCFILTYAGLEGVTSIVSAQRYAKRALRTLKGLSKRGTSWPESCAQAVEHIILALGTRMSTSTNPEVGEQVSIPAASVPISGREMRSRDVFGVQTLSDGNARRQNDQNTSNPRFGSITPRRTASRRASERPHSGEQCEVHAHVENSSVGTHAANSVQYHETNLQNGLPDTGTSPGVSHGVDFMMGLDESDWLLDPLSALDFSNFAQAGSSDSAMGFTFY